MVFPTPKAAIDLYSKVDKASFTTIAMIGQFTDKLKSSGSHRCQWQATAPGLAPDFMVFVLTTCTAHLLFLPLQDTIALKGMVIGRENRY
jgi:hypothetical protein